MGNMIIILILLAIVVGIVWNLIKNKKAGKSSCGCGCGSCPMNGKCHKQ